MSSGEPHSEATVNNAGNRCVRPREVWRKSTLDMMFLSLRISLDPKKRGLILYFSRCSFGSPNYQWLEIPWFSEWLIFHVWNPPKMNSGYDCCKGLRWLVDSYVHMFTQFTLAGTLRFATFKPPTNRLLSYLKTSYKFGTRIQLYMEL